MEIANEMVALAASYARDGKESTAGAFRLFAVTLGLPPLPAVSTPAFHGKVVGAGQREHDLKTWPEYFDAVASGQKTFEIRKDDRNFRVGDTLRLRKFDPVEEKYTGAECKRIVAYALRDAVEFGLHEGYVILGLTTPVEAPKAAEPPVCPTCAMAPHTDGACPDATPKAAEPTRGGKPVACGRFDPETSIHWACRVCGFSAFVHGVAEPTAPLTPEMFAAMERVAREQVYRALRSMVHGGAPDTAPVLARTIRDALAKLGALAKES